MAAGSGCSLRIRVQPRASRDRVAGFRVTGFRVTGSGEDVLRLSVTAPPADGEANAAVLDLLAEALGTPKSRLAIVRGHEARDKVVAVELLSLEEVRERLARCDT